MWVEDHAIADDGQLALPHDARRQQRQLVDLAVDDQSVAGIVAALETHHDIGTLRQPVDDLALAFVAPLRADDHHIGHNSSLRSSKPACRPRKRQASIATRPFERDISLRSKPADTISRSLHVLYLVGPAD